LDFSIVVVKLGYLYPQLRDIAPVHLMALTTGFCNLDMRTLPFKNVHRPSYPLDNEMSWQAGF
jgi:microcystin degradation protein MlrC